MPKKNVLLLVTFVELKGKKLNRYDLIQKKGNLDIKRRN